MTVLLIRGIPGSGKSTLADMMLASIKYCKHYEADMFFTKRGIYKFNLKQSGISHCWCLTKVSSAICLGYDVIVSNIFPTVSSVNVYKKLAEDLGADFQVFKTTGQFQSIHSVSQEVIDKNVKVWQDYPNEIVVNF